MNSKPWKILIADDDPTACLLFRAALAGDEFLPMLVDNGDDALAEFKRGDFATALLDVEMPGLDGLALCAEIRRLRGSEFPLFLVTGRSDAAFLSAAHAVAADYLAKPIDWAKLPALLRQRLGEQQR